MATSQHTVSYNHSSHMTNVFNINILHKLGYDTCSHFTCHAMFSIAFHMPIDLTECIPKLTLAIWYLMAALRNIQPLPLTHYTVYSI